MNKRLAMVVGAGLYALWNITAWWISDPQDSYDTYRYFLPITDVQNPGVVVNALFVTVQSRDAITAIQVGISVLVWLALAVVVLRRLSYSPGSWVLAVLVLLFSMTEQVWSWHLLTYTESMTTSVVVLWLASIVWLSSFEGSPIRLLAPVVAATALLALTRPQLLVIAVPVLTVLGFWWWRRRGSAWPGLVALLAVVPFAAFAAWRVWQVSEVPLYRFRYALNNLFEKESSFREYALATAPPCETVTHALGSADPWNDVHALDKTMMGPCPETWLWYRSDNVLLTSWGRAIPGQTLQEFATTMPTVVLPAGSGQLAMPVGLSSLLLNPDHPWVWAVFYLTVGVVVAVVSRVKVRLTPLAVLAWLIIVLSCIAYLLLVWGSDGYDIERHVFPFLPMIAIACLVLPSTLPRAASPVARE